MTLIFAVAGKPVLPSASPAMFNAAFRALSVDAVYTRIAASGGRDITETAKSIGIRGLNVTSPFKEEIMPFLDDVDGPAQAIGAVNTVIFDGGRWKGYNTDHRGAADALARNNVDSERKRAVVLGASGAGRAAVFGLLSSGLCVTLVNRSFDKARAWARTLGCEAVPMEDLGKALAEADILVSCITATERIVPPSSLRPGLIVLDANYTRPTALARDAAEAGCRVIDGREWLLYQALPAFKLMSGQEAPEGIMRNALYETSPLRKTNIGLIGFMGAGKSTAGAELAANLGMNAHDTDEAISTAAGLTIPEIFGRLQEEGFRSLEEDQVDRVRHISRTVVSFGGGAVLRDKNVEAIREACVAVWLWAGPDTVLDRIGDAPGRPLMAGPEGKERIKGLLHDRLPFYARAADLIVNTDKLTEEETMQRICDEIDRTR